MSSANKSLFRLSSILGGTWLAVSSFNDTIKLASLLNIVDTNHSHPRKSRGAIVADFVTDKDVSIKEYNDSLNKDHDIYSSFNFVSIQLKNKNQNSIFYQSNSPRHTIELSDAETEGFFGFGNSPYEIPLKKVSHGLNLFKDTFHKHSNESKESLVASLMELLKDKKKCYPDAELKSHCPVWAKYLSSINVRAPDDYGTRTRTVILVDQNNQVDYYEETMEGIDPDGIWESSHITL